MGSHLDKRILSRLFVKRFCEFSDTFHFILISEHDLTEFPLTPTALDKELDEIYNSFFLIFLVLIYPFINYNLESCPSTQYLEFKV